MRETTSLKNVIMNDLDVEVNPCDEGTGFFLQDFFQSKNQSDTETLHIIAKETSECTENGDTGFTKVIYFDYKKAIDITFDQNGGILKQILKPGDGDTTPGYGDKVYILYTGYLRIGDSLKAFDKSEDKVYFHLGRGAVIQGLDCGISTMKKNEVALFVIQPEYSYESLGNVPTVPPNTVVFFEVELLKWKLEDLSLQKDEGILRKVIKKGEGLAFPNEGAHVRAHIIGHFNKHLVEDRDVDFLIGEGCAIGVPEGVELALLKFKLHENSILLLGKQYSYELHEKFGNSSTDEITVEYEVTLHSFEKAKEVWEMDSDEKYEESVKSKAKGINYFQDGNYKLALKQFKKIIAYLENEPGISSDSEEARKSLLISGYLNASLCQMKMENFFEAIKMCDKVIENDNENEKALYRRGQSRMSVNDCEEALIDFQKVLKINPSNSASKHAIELCKNKIDKQNRKDKEVYNNMFQKFVHYDEKGGKGKALGTETGVWERRAEISLSDDCNGVLKMLIPFCFDE